MCDLSGWQAFKACLQRECILTDRYQFLYKFRTCQVLIMATITGTVFLRTRQAPTSLLNGLNYMSVCFYSVMVLFFNGQTELTIAVGGPDTSVLCLKYCVGGIQVLNSPTRHKLLVCASSQCRYATILLAAGY